MEGAIITIVNAHLLSASLEHAGIVMIVNLMVVLLMHLLNFSCRFASYTIVSIQLALNSDLTDEMVDIEQCRKRF
jgi:hypothetical protein